MDGNKAITTNTPLLTKKSDGYGSHFKIETHLDNWKAGSSDLHEDREKASAYIQKAFDEKAEVLNLGHFNKVTNFPDLSQFTWLKQISFMGCEALNALPTLPETEGLQVFSKDNVLTMKFDPSAVIGEEFDADNPAHMARLGKYFEQIIPMHEFEKTLDEIKENCPTIRSAIKENPATMYKQMILWTIRCALTGGGWTLGYAIDCILMGNTPSAAVKSPLAWACGGIGAGIGEAVSVAFINYFCSDKNVLLKPNSNGAGWKQNLVEVGCWGVSCAVAGFVWQPMVNTCSPEQLSQPVPAGCMLPVAFVTGTAFGLTLLTSKTLIELYNAQQNSAARLKSVENNKESEQSQEPKDAKDEVELTESESSKGRRDVFFTLADEDEDVEKGKTQKKNDYSGSNEALQKASKQKPRWSYFRPLTKINTFMDSVFFTYCVGAAADAAFLLTSSTAPNAPFNHLPFSNATHFGNDAASWAATGNQVLLGAGSTMVGGSMGLLTLAVINGTLHVYDNRNRLWLAAQEYGQNLSLNSQCTLL